MTEQQYRIEHDTMGEVKVPVDALWRAQTQRAVENFPISGRGLESQQIRAMGLLKAACAIVNKDRGLLPGEQADASAGQLHGTTLDQPYHPVGTALTDTDGRPLSLTRDTDARLTLVFFGYTHCPDICQLVMSTLAAARLRLPEDQRRDVDVVLVTTDPAPITEFSPIVTPGQTIAPPPTQTPSPIVIGRESSIPRRRSTGSTGCSAVSS